MVATTAVPSVSPAIPRDFPDPAVLAVGNTYYAYSTASPYGNRLFHVPVQSSTSLTGGWGSAKDAMPDLPSWVAKAAGHSVWAPEVAARSDGTYLLYFTARSATQNAQCIGAATASSPTGPFRSVGTAPLVCHPAENDSIDPKPFTDTDGTQYLLYSSGRGNATIWLQQMTADGTRTVGTRRALIKADRTDEAHIVEAPTLIKHGSRYVLFYSGNAYTSGSYFVNYASATSLTGAFTKHAGQFLNKATIGGKYKNPGGQDVVPGAKRDYLVFHAFTAPTARSLFVVGLSWDDNDNPTLDEDDVALTDMGEKQ
ncbi:MAG TPA: glycoside hydrolase family 43 protein [Pseudonocardia sp.]